MVGGRKQICLAASNRGLSKDGATIGPLREVDAGAVNMHVGLGQAVVSNLNRGREPGERSWGKQRDSGRDKARYGNYSGHAEPKTVRFFRQDFRTLVLISLLSFDGNLRG